jgi:hypothetical protein
MVHSKFLVNTRRNFVRVHSYNVVELLRTFQEPDFSGGIIIVDRKVASIYVKFQRGYSQIQESAGLQVSLQSHRALIQDISLLDPQEIPCLPGDKFVLRGKVYKINSVDKVSSSLFAIAEVSEEEVSV